MTAPAAERGFLALAAISLVLKVGVEAGLPSALLSATVVASAGFAAAAVLSRHGHDGGLDGWRLLLALCALSSLPQVHTRVGGDGFEYYALARSLVFDQDLDFDNEFAGLGAQTVIGRSGEPTSRFPVGLALLWIPSLLLSRITAATLSAFGVAVDTNGFGGFHQAAATVTSFALAVLGLALLERLLRRWFSPALAALTVLAVFFATPLHFYAVANPSMSHAASAAAATLVVALWLSARAGSETRPWLLVGLAGGLMSLIRIQDGVLLVMPALDLLLQRRRDGRALLALAAGPALAAALQLGLWWWMYGGGFLQLAAQQGHFGRPELNVVGVLFSARHGLFTWTPLYLAAVFGTLLWLGRERRLAGLWLLGIAASVTLNSLQWDWWGADSFGQRRLLGLTPLLALGLAQALSWLQRRPLVPIGAGLLLLIAWNQQLAYIYNSELVAGKGQAVSLERLAPAQVDVLARRVVRLADRMPRRVWVLVYDNLRGVWLDEGPRSLGGNFDFGDAEPDGFPILGHGWSDPLREGAIGFRYSNSRRSWLRIPVMSPGDFDVTLRIRAAFDAAPVSVSLVLGGETAGTAALDGDWREVGFRLPARLLQPGVNHLALVYSTTPADVDPGFKGRNAAAAVDWIRFRRAAGPR